MSETWRGSYVYNDLSAAACHIQQHFPPACLCTYNIVSLLWANHSCCASIHLLTLFASFSFILLCLLFALPPPPPLTVPTGRSVFVSPSFQSATIYCSVTLCLSPSILFPCFILHPHSGVARITGGLDLHGALDYKLLPVCFAPLLIQTGFPVSSSNLPLQHCTRPAVLLWLLG